MNRAHPSTKHAPPAFPPASGSNTRSRSSSQGSTSRSQRDERSSLQLQRLMVDSDEDGSPASQLDEVSTEESEEGGKHTFSMSRVASMSKSYTVEEEKTVVRKFDRRLVLFMALLYMLSFLDRSNIGNARIAGLETSLSLQPGQYEWLLTAFYITYISFEWMTLLYRIIPPHIYISLCVLSWGLVASLQSISTSFSSLVVFRALLGISEAAFGPGVPFYLSFFYKRSELAYRVGLFISAAPLATSCASTIAWLIAKLFQHGPLEPWRALFLIEGFPSIIFAYVAWHVIPDSPSSAKYLTPRERKVARLRLQSEDHPSHNPTTTTTTHNNNRLSLTDLLTTLSSPTPYLTSLMFFTTNISFSSLPVFLPTILQSSRLHPLTAQLLSAPPYLLSFPFVLLTSHLSDHLLHSRAYTLIAVSLLSSLSYLLLTLTGLYHTSLSPPSLFLTRYLCLCTAAMGFFAAVTLILTWTLNNQPSATGKGVGLVLVNLLGQCGPLLGTRIYPQSAAPWYVHGMAVCAACMAATAALAAALRWWLVRENAKAGTRQRRQEEGGEWEMEELAGSEDDGSGGEGAERGAGQGLVARKRRRRRSRSAVKERFVYML